MIMLAGIFIITINRTKHLEDPREKGRTADAASIWEIALLDNANTNAVFVFTKDYPQFKNLKNRVIHMKPLNLDLSLDFDKAVHKGFMGPVYILLPSYYVGVRASVIMKCFPGYKGFKLKELSNNYVLYYSNQPR
jgi:hypothetical protein